MSKKVIYVNPESGKTLDWSDLRRQVLRRDGHKCQMCGAHGRLEAHHIKPRPLGASTFENLITLCPNCHDIAEMEQLLTAELIRNWYDSKPIRLVKKRTPTFSLRLFEAEVQPKKVDLRHTLADEPIPAHVPNSELPVLFEGVDCD